MVEKIYEMILNQAANVSPFNAKLKFVIGDDVILIDGSDGQTNKVSKDDVEADTVITLDAETFNKLKDGSLNPMMAVMTGKVKIKGDMGLAMKLQSLL